MTHRLLACCAVVGAGIASPAVAGVLNGNFETGDLTNWTITFTPGGTTAVMNVESFDIDGPGPLGSSLAARFSVGRAAGVTTGNQGIMMTQLASVVAGNAYQIDFDWAAWRPAGQGSNTQGGIFDIIVNGVSIANALAGATSGAAPRFGHLTGNFVAAATGEIEVGVMITRPFTVPTPTAPTLFQFIDNFTMVPTPGTTALFALAGLAGVRRRR